MADWLPRWLYATRDRIVSHYLQAITAGGYGSGEPGKLNLNGGRMPNPPYDWRSRAMKHTTCHLAVAHEVSAIQTKLFKFNSKLERGSTNTRTRLPGRGGGGRYLL